MKPNIIAIYTSGKLFSGQKIASEIMVQGLLSRNWKVIVINPPGLDRVSPLFRSKFKFILQIISISLRMLVVWFNIVNHCRNSILHINLGQTKLALIREGFPVILKSLLLNNSPVIVSLHGSWFLSWSATSVESKIFLAIAKGSNYITVLGDRHRDKLVDLGVPQNKIKIMDNTCTLNAIPYELILRKHHLCSNQNSTVNVLFLSSLFEEKGYVEFVQAIGRLAESEKLNISVTICGKVTIGREKNLLFPTHQEAEAWLTSQLFTINNSRNVRLTWVNGADGVEKYNLFKDAHIFVLPSRIEGQPISLLEALASGAAIITTKVGEIPNTLDTSTALFLNEINYHEIADRIMTLSLNHSHRQSLALNGIRLFEARFSHEEHINRWENLIYSLAT